jgi:hypothetical protein
VSGIPSSVATSSASSGNPRPANRRNLFSEDKRISLMYLAFLFGGVCGLTAGALAQDPTYYIFL